MDGRERHHFAVVCTLTICVPLGLLSSIAGTIGVPPYITGDRPQLVGASVALYVIPLVVFLSTRHWVVQRRHLPGVSTHSAEATNFTAEVDLASVVIHAQFVHEDNAHTTTTEPVTPERPE